MLYLWCFIDRANIGEWSKRAQTQELGSSTSLIVTYRQCQDCRNGARSQACWLRLQHYPHCLRCRLPSVRNPINNDLQEGWPRMVSTRHDHRLWRYVYPHSLRTDKGTDGGVALLAVNLRSWLAPLSRLLPLPMVHKGRVAIKNRLLYRLQPYSWRFRGVACFGNFNQRIYWQVSADHRMSGRLRY